MELLSQQPIVPTALPPNHKKLYIIVGIAAFLVIICIPFILGLLSPTPSGKTPNAVFKAENPSSAHPSEVAPSLGAQAKVTQQVPTPIQYETQYKQTPVPTSDLDALVPTTPVTPTPTPLPGPFYVANGKQNDLSLRLYTPDITTEIYEVQLMNTKTHEVRIMGYTYLDSPGDSMFFINNYSQVLFLGGTKTNLQTISIYSIPNRKVIKTITFADITQQLPSLPVQTTAILSNMLLSPDAKRVALAYGNTFSERLIDPGTVIFVINLTTKKMEILPAKGLTKDWKDNNTLEYQINSGDPNHPTVQSVNVPTL